MNPAAGRRGQGEAAGAAEGGYSWPHARGIHHLPRLRVLNLYFNRIEQLAELLRLRVVAPTLSVLDLRLNPVTRLEGYRRCAARARR